MLYMKMEFSFKKFLSGVCVCVCVWERERDRDTERERFILTGNGSHNHGGWDDPRPAVGKLEA